MSRTDNELWFIRNGGCRVTVGRHSSVGRAEMEHYSLFSLETNASGQIKKCLDVFQQWDDFPSVEITKGSVELQYDGVMLNWRPLPLYPLSLMDSVLESSHFGACRKTLVGSPLCRTQEAQIQTSKAGVLLLEGLFLAFSYGHSAKPSKLWPNHQRSRVIVYHPSHHILCFKCLEYFWPGSFSRTCCKIFLFTNLHPKDAD